MKPDERYRKETNLPTYYYDEDECEFNHNAYMKWCENRIDLMDKDLAEKEALIVKLENRIELLMEREEKP